MATLGTLFQNLGQRFRAWREREQALAELNALDDRMLADIGLRRSDIPYILFETRENLLPTGRATLVEAANANLGGRQAA